MSDLRRVLNELDQKHQAYTKKFALIKSRLDQLEGRLAAAEGYIGALQDAIEERKTPKKAKR